MIVPFKKEHLEVMEIRPHEKALITSNAGLLDAFQAGSIAFTGIVDGRVICCGGVSPFLMGNAEIWLIPSVYVERDPMIFARNLRKHLFNIRRDLALSRMQTSCIDDELHNRWMEFLGFTKEGHMKKFYNGVNYNLWGRVWE